MKNKNEILDINSNNINNINNDMNENEENNNEMSITKLFIKKNLKEILKNDPDDNKIIIQPKNNENRNDFIYNKSNNYQNNNNNNFNLNNFSKNNSNRNNFINNIINSNEDEINTKIVLKNFNSNSNNKNFNNNSQNIIFNYQNNNNNINLNNNINFNTMNINNKNNNYNNMNINKNKFNNMNINNINNNNFNTMNINNNNFNIISFNSNGIFPNQMGNSVNIGNNYNNNINNFMNTNNNSNNNCFNYGNNMNNTFSNYNYNNQMSLTSPIKNFQNQNMINNSCFNYPMNNNNNFINNMNFVNKNMNNYNNNFLNNSNQINFNNNQINTFHNMQLPFNNMNNNYNMNLYNNGMLNFNNNYFLQCMQNMFFQQIFYKYLYQQYLFHYFLSKKNSIQNQLSPPLPQIVPEFSKNNLYQDLLDILREPNIQAKNDEEIINQFSSPDLLSNDLTTEIITEFLNLEPELLNGFGNKFKGNWAFGEYRGGIPYNPPRGWIGFGLNVINKYDNGNNDWLACDGREGEWCVGYHGIGRNQTSDAVRNMILSILRNNLQPGSAQACKNEIDINHRPNKVGVGVYCSAHINVLEEYAGHIVIRNKKYKVGIMVRCKRDKIRIPMYHKNYWVLDGNFDQLRPYRLLIKRMNSFY